MTKVDTKELVEILLRVLKMAVTLLEKYHRERLAT
jgi:hypothetical protein